MAFKSEAQRRKFGELLTQGKINQSLYDSFDADTDPQVKLPERTTWQKALKIQSVKVLRAQKVSRK